MREEQEWGWAQVEPAVKGLARAPGTGSHHPLALGKEGAPWELGGGKPGQSASASGTTPDTSSHGCLC